MCSPRNVRKEIVCVQSKKCKQEEMKREEPSIRAHLGHCGHGPGVGTSLISFLDLNRMLEVPDGGEVSVLTLLCTVNHRCARLAHVRNYPYI